MADEWREQIGFLRGLDGMAAHILLALLVAGRRLTMDDLELTTRCERRAIRKGLALLEALGLVEADMNGWALPAAGRERLVGPSGGGGGGARAARVPSSSSVFIHKSMDEEKKKKKSAPGAEAEIARLLQRAGLGRQSPKMRQLLALGLDEGYVREHVTARESALERGDEYPVGWLINKLACGDPAPVCRCGRCEACQARARAKYPTVMR